MIYLRRIVGHSMLPAFRDGQLIIFRRSRSYQNGQVVLLQHEGLEKIKRVAGIKSGQVFLRGDNPRASTDSRDFGWLDTRQIKGRQLAQKT